MYIGKLTATQIKDLLKTMFLAEARFERFYNSNLPSILDTSIFDYKIEKSNGNEYLVVEVKNGDIFVFDDCNYIKFVEPKMTPLSTAKNAIVYVNYMRSIFKDYYDFEIEYNKNLDNIVNIVNFCDDLIIKRKNKGAKSKDIVKSKDIEITY